jgi:hypothetical protein
VEEEEEGMDEKEEHEDEISNSADIEIGKKPQGKKKKETEKVEHPMVRLARDSFSKIESGKVKVFYFTFVSNTYITELI